MLELIAAQDVPEFITPDRQIRDMPARIVAFEALLREHERHPYLLANLALCLESVGAHGSSVFFLREASFLASRLAGTS